jgi:hypothetical protein
MNDVACGAGRRCFIGVCVPANWTDQTIAPVGPVSAGHIEKQRFNGSGTDYTLYISNSVSSQSAKLLQ